jgi:hypothetical protein
MEKMMINHLKGPIIKVVDDHPPTRRIGKKLQKVTSVKTLTHNRSIQGIANFPTISVLNQPQNNQNNQVLNQTPSLPDF